MSEIDKIKEEIGWLKKESSMTWETCNGNR